MRLLSKSNIKLLKGEQENYLSYGLSLAPYNVSGHNVCPNSTPGCRAGCVFFAGNGFYPAVQQARIARTKFWFSNRAAFKAQFIAELKLAIKQAARKGMKLCVRLNVFSDIAWEQTFPELFTLFPTVQFYDYTKNARRMKKFLEKDFPRNYYLTFSRSETNQADFAKVMILGGNVAVPFYLRKNDKLPKTCEVEYGPFNESFSIVDGDKSDLRFRDKKNVIVGLKAKGTGRSDKTGFIIRNVV